MRTLESCLAELTFCHHETLREAKQAQANGDFVKARNLTNSVDEIFSVIDELSKTKYLH